MEALQPQSPRAPCPHCQTDNPVSARFCKACGASLRPPPTCPACGTATTPDSKFCTNCGTQLVGSRPRPVLVPPVAAHADASESDPSDEPVRASTDRDQLRAEAAKLPRPKPPSSSILANVLVFVAIMMGLVVVIYKMNKDAPKTMSPFEGGPPPSAQARAQPASGSDARAASDSAEAADASAAITGQIVLGEGQASGGGSLFIIVRQQGVTRGPPVAVRKFESPTFPQQFSVTSAHTMFQGMPFTGPFDVHARLDQDGNAMTKTAGDLVATTPATNIKPGSKPVVIALDKRL